MGKNEQDWHPAAVFLMALAPRLALFPWFRHLKLAGDERMYWEAASRPLLQVQFHPPLWAFVLWPVRALTDNPVGGRLCTVLCGSITVVLVFFLANRLFGRPNGRVAATILSFYPDNVVWSHLLWSEIFFSMAVVASCLLFFPHDREKPPRLLRAVVPVGVSLLAKEFAGIVFAGMAAAHFLGDAPRKKRTFFLACALFLLPVAIYVGAFSLKAGQLQTGFGAVRILASQETPFLPQSDNRDETDSVLRKMSNGLMQMWGARSFALWRLKELFGPTAPRWFPFMIGVHALVITFGMIGLVTEDVSPFSVFAWTCVISLCVLAAAGFLLSRFRTSFMFIFVIEAARVVCRPDDVVEKLRRTWRRAFAIGSVATLIAAIAATYRFAGTWG